MSDSSQANHAFAELLERACALEDDAIAELYTRYLPVVYRVILARVGDVPLAEDLTSETFMAMVDSIKSLRARDEMGFAAWLHSITRNKIKLYYRALAARPTTQHELPPQDEPRAQAEEGDPLGVVLSRERWAQFTGAMNALTDEQRLVLHYRCVMGLDAAEVGALMGREPGAIRGLQFRALSSLARVLIARGIIAPKSITRRAASLTPMPYARHHDDPPDAARLVPPQRSQPR